MVYFIACKNQSGTVISKTVEDFFKEENLDAGLASLETKFHNRKVKIGLLVYDSDKSKIRVSTDRKAFVFMKNIFIQLLKQGVDWSTLETFAISTSKT